MEKKIQTHNGDIEISKSFTSVRKMKKDGYILPVDAFGHRWVVKCKINGDEKKEYAAAPKGKIVCFFRWISNNFSRGFMRILIGLLAAVAIFVLVKNVLILSSVASREGVSAEAIASAYQGTLLSNGLTIIAIAIAIWAGLSITNAVARKDVLLLQKKTQHLQGIGHQIREDLGKAKTDLGQAKEDLEKANTATTVLKQTNETLRTDIDKLQNNIDILQQQQGHLAVAFLSSFRSELLKTKTDVATMKIYKNFNSLKLNNDGSNVITLLQKMIIIEQLFAFVYANHTSRQKYGDEIISKANMAINEIESLYNGDIPGNEFSKNMIEQYLQYRHAELLFYKGYSLSGETKIETYKAAIEKYDASWGFVSSSESGDIKDRDDDETVEMKLYLVNTILESYNKWATSLIEMRRTSEVKELYDSSTRFIDTQLQAISLLENRKAYERISEVYYRNLGCYYTTIKKASIDASFNEDDILELFEKALRLAIDDDNHILPYRVDNIFHVLVQHLHGRITRRLNNTHHFMQELRQSPNAVDDTIALQDKLYKILIPARKDVPRKRLYYSVHGLLCALVCAEKTLGYSVPSFTEDAKFYLKEAKEDYDFLMYTFSDKADNYTSRLCDCLSEF